MQKYICCILIIALILSMCSCIKLSNVMNFEEQQTQNQIASKVENIVTKLGIDQKSTKSDLLNEIKKSNEEDRVDMLMDFADDMAKAQFFGLVNSDILSIAGNVVKEYPHPLLLNNYGAMLTELAPEDGLFFLLQALEYEPTNPVILTNIANMYIQLDDFNAAEQYAKEALVSMPDYGASYQVLTTCHLNNGNSILASETMVKGAKHFFNELTIYHFENFIDAVEEQLDPKEDEYPLKEEFIEELYYIAKENVDTKDVSQNIDIPEAQLTLQDIQVIGSADDLKYYVDYFTEESSKAWENYIELGHEETNYSIILDEEEAKESKSKGIVFHIEKNLRQRCAFEVLQSFYSFKIEKEKLLLEDELEALEEEMRSKNDDIKDKYIKQEEVDGEHAKNLYNEYEKALLAANFSKAEQISAEIISEGNRIAIESAERKVEEEKKILENELYYVNKMKDMIYVYYANSKQSLEEYWLRAGGILKYITNKNVFNLLDTQLRKDVNYFIQDPIGKMLYCASIVAEQHNSINMANYNLEVTKSIVSGNEVDQVVVITEQREEQELDPKMQDPVISTYPEKNAVGDLGVEFYFFGIISASASTDGTDYSLEVSATKGLFTGKIGGKTITEGDSVSKEAYMTANVGVNIDAKNIIPQKGKGKLFGSIKLGGSESTSVYNVMSGNKMTDFGTIRTSEKNIGVGVIGVGKETSIKRSSMTGIAIKNKTKKYKFAFLTYTVPDN